MQGDFTLIDASPASACRFAICLLIVKVVVGLSEREINMGKTVPTYRIAVEEEIAKWKPFRDALPSEEEKQAYDEVMDMIRNNAMAASNSCNPILFEPMVMSILLGQERQMRTLRRKLDALLVAKLPVEKAE